MERIPTGLWFHHGDVIKELQVILHEFIAVIWETLMKICYWYVSWLQLSHRCVVDKGQIIRGCTFDILPKTCEHTPKGKEVGVDLSRSGGVNGTELIDPNVDDTGKPQWNKTLTFVTFCVCEGVGKEVLCNQGTTTFHPISDFYVAILAFSGYFLTFYKPT